MHTPQTWHVLTYYQKALYSHRSINKLSKSGLAWCGPWSAPRSNPIRNSQNKQHRHKAQQTEQSSTYHREYHYSWTEPWRLTKNHDLHPVDRDPSLQPLIHPPQSQNKQQQQCYEARHTQYHPHYIVFGIFLVRQSLTEDSFKNQAITSDMWINDLIFLKWTK